MRAIGVALLGLGNVGSGVVKLLEDNAEGIAARIGGRIEVRRIVVREVDKARLVEVDRALVSTDVAAALADPEVRIVVELIGGLEPARGYVAEAIARGKHVVTANKALLAEHGEEIFEAAEQRGVDIFYEASVGGGVPIVRALRDGLASDRISELCAIVNGTSNYILTRMRDEGRPFAEILAEAQAAGYAEADPALDVDGWDAAHKLCILTSLCFGVKTRVDQILVDGLRDLTPLDFAHAQRLGYAIKPLASARDHGDSVEMRVHPTLIPSRWLLAAVDGVHNAVYVSSQALGGSLYYGRGAGMMATAVAVVSDVIEVARDILGAAASGLPLRLRIRNWQNRPIRPPAELTARFYLRLDVAPGPGVLGRIDAVLGRHGIAVRDVTQVPGAGAAVTLVLTTEQATEGAMAAARRELGALEVVLGAPRLLRIVD